MRRLMGIFLPAVTLVFLLSLPAGADYKHNFTGASKCRICHMSAKKGDQFGVWKASKHALAYQTLTTPEAKVAAEKVGQGGKNPAENPACLKCHVTGWDAPAEKLGAKYDKTEGVGCESCHGPGEDYSPIKIMKDKALAMAAGMTLPKKEDCVKCHNKESPSYKPFDYDTFYKKIAHDNPETP